MSVEADGYQGQDVNVDGLWPETWQCVGPDLACDRIGVNSMLIMVLLLLSLVAAQEG